MIMSLALIGPAVGPPEREGDGTPIEVLRKAIKWDRTIILRELCVTLLIVGLGQIGDRLAQLAKAFDMHVISVAVTRALVRDTRMRCTRCPSSTRCCRRPILLPSPAR